MKKLFFASGLIFLLFFRAFSSDFNFEHDERYNFLQGHIQAKENFLPHEDFLKAALTASGCTDDKILSLTSILKNHFAEFEKTLTAETSQTEKAQKALSFLYEKIISKYSEMQTLVDVALEQGIYNCVSSDILYIYFLKCLEIPVVAVETPDHAFCTVTIDDRKIDVETTNPYGFEPGKKNQIPNSKKYISVPQKKYRGRHEISDFRLIALILNNRIVTLQRKIQNSKSIELAVDALYIQNNSSEAMTTFYQCVTNASVDLSNSQKNDEALQLVREAKAKFGDSPIFENNTLAIINNSVAESAKKNQFEEGFLTLTKNQDLLSPSDYNELTRILTENQLNYIIKNEPFENAINAVHGKKSVLPQKNYEKLVSFAYQTEANRISKGENFIEAAKFSEKGLLELPNDANLTRQKASFMRNYEVKIHNQAAKLANSGKKDEAKLVVEEGLKNYPESKTLRTDLQRLSR
ncbi:hypothetical protein [Treponema zioleckii]|uniref:hypothetical protein n=1 Tax=Treponema zioleckii TaxID=331680 RepID=UPI00168B7F5D|nr:hypothetical protein [Treponema zioleckii]